MVIYNIGISNFILKNILPRRGRVKMDLAYRIDNNLVAIIASCIFLTYIFNRLDRKEKKSKMFVGMFTLTTIELIVETTTCIINGQPFSWLIPITTVAHIILFILAPVVTYKWYIFARLWGSKERKLNTISDTVIFIPVVINAIVVLLSPFKKFVFYISQNNIYERGSLFFVPAVLTYFYLACGFIVIIKSREKIRKGEFLPLLLFGVLPTIGGIIQALFYGFLLIWSTTAFALIILYVHIQQQMMQVDYLTGAWTRGKLYKHLSNRINNNKIKTFSIVFIDLDNFKMINDNYGHNEGDKALITMVNIISDILRKDDSITRYGGDEFVLFLNVDSKEDVEVIMKRIFIAINDYNKTGGKPYKLEYSYGYDLYDFNSHMTVVEYINHVDRLMYSIKSNKKIIESEVSID